ncbi:hypothetical protein DWW79_00905 [Alistipes sp. AF17-16]|nr:hypothetical protein DW082_01415 [Alistipes sp. AF48-12]RHR67540.1 hypothetical protein DWW79_00905 [Alistipes sp. AF17-16]
MPQELHKTAATPQKNSSFFIGQIFKFWIRWNKNTFFSQNRVVSVRFLPTVDPDSSCDRVAVLSHRVGLFS